VSAGALLSGYGVHVVILLAGFILGLIAVTR
jgi:hypothetical protein